MLNNLLDQLRLELSQSEGNNDGIAWPEICPENYFVSPFRPFRRQIIIRLINHLENYQRVMAEEESVQRKKLANEWVLKADPVYNSSLASKELRDAIVERSFPCDQEVFEMAYTEIFEEKFNNVAIVKLDAYDLVPKKIPAIMILESGLKERYLLEKCQSHDITLRKLEDLLFLRKEHKAGLYKLIELCDRGFSIIEIEFFMTVREGTDFSISINKIVEFWQCFNCPDDPGQIVNAIMRIAAEFDIYPSQAVKRIMDTARKNEQFEIEGVLDFMLIDAAEVIHALNED